jgi:glycine cleavage system H protein
MKELQELNLPNDVYYSKDHEWARKSGDTVTVGISDYAQDQLGDVVFVEVPAVGDSFDAGAEFGTVESVKAVSELYMPIGGEITAVNEELADSPGLVNTDPYNKGWMVSIKPADPAELDSLMDSDAYMKMLKELE